MWESVRHPAGSGDENVGCSSNPSDEGFVTLVQGDMSNTDSVSEGGRVGSDVGGGSDSDEGKNRDQCFE